MENVSSAKGRWSASNGTLNLCPDEQHINGKTIIDMAGFKQEMPMTDAPKQDSSFSYTCDGDSLQTVMEMAGSEPLVTKYQRLR